MNCHIFMNLFHKLGNGIECHIIRNISDMNKEMKQGAYNAYTARYQSCKGGLFGRF